jgi:hypothetical protein
MFRRSPSLEKLDARTLLAADVFIDSMACPSDDPSIGLLRPADEQTQKVSAGPGSGPHVVDQESEKIYDTIILDANDAILQKVRSWEAVDPNNPHKDGQDGDPLAFHWGV